MGILNPGLFMQDVETCGLILLKLHFWQTDILVCHAMTNGRNVSWT